MAARERGARERQERVQKALKSLEQVEQVKADLRTYRGLGPFLVRGLRKVRCVVLWSAPAYHPMHFGKVLLPA